MALSGTFDHLNPTFTISAEASGDNTRKYSVTVKSNFTGSSSYGYNFKIYVGTSFSNKKVIINFSGSHDKNNQINESYNGTYAKGIKTLKFWMYCQDRNCSRKEYSNVDKPIITLTGLYKPIKISASRSASTGRTVTCDISVDQVSTYDLVRYGTCLWDSDQELISQDDFTSLRQTSRTKKYTGLTQGIRYYVSAYADDGSAYAETDKINIWTWGSSIQTITPKSTTAVVESVTLHHPTQPGIADIGTMIWEVYDSSGSKITSGTAAVLNPTGSDSGYKPTGSFTIRGLTPATEYTLKTYPQGLTDAASTATFTTKDAPNNLQVSVVSTTGETATLSATWGGGSSENVTAAITLNGVTKNVTTKGGTVKFTGLSHGRSYNYSATGTGDETGQFDTDSGSLTTYGASISASTRSAKTIVINRFGYTTGTNGSAPTQMHYELYDSTGTTVIKNDTTVSIGETGIVLSGLAINTSYRLKYWLGSPTDTIEWTTVSTGRTISGLSLSATASTGTTITIRASWSENDESGSSCVVSLNGTSKNVSNGGSVKFTGLSLGTSYTATGQASGDEGGSASGSCSGKTYNIFIDFDDPTTTTQGITFRITNGNSGDKSSSIKYRYKLASSSTWSSVQSCSTSGATISGLTQDTTYDIEYYIDGLYDASNNLDTVKTAQFSTLGALSNLRFTVEKVTGTTVTIKVTWSAAGSTGVVATVKVNGVSKTVSSSGGTLQFTGLTNGSTYNITGSAKDDEGNSTTGTSKEFTTYKISITLLDKSTRAAKYKVDIIAGDDETLDICSTVAVSSTESNPSTSKSGNELIQSMLNHATQYTITGWIKDMKDEKGNLDTKITTTFVTKKLTLVCTSSSYTQHGITSLWQASADNADYDKCQITDTNIEFVIASCNNEPFAESGYQTTTKKGSVSGSYKTLVSSGLDYYAYYKITCMITDGVNKVSSIVTQHTDFPYSYVYDNSSSKFRKVMPYVYYNGKWQKAPAFIKDDKGKWHESNGE